MRSKIPVYLFVLTLFPLLLFSQNPGYLKVGIGISFDRAKFFSEEAGARFLPARYPAPVWAYEQYIGNYFSVEAGACMRSFYSSIVFDDTESSALSLDAEYYSFSLHLKTRLPLFKKLFIAPVIGASLNHTDSFMPIWLPSLAPWQKATLEKDFTSNYFTVDLGAGLHYTLGHSWILSLEYCYYANSKTIAIATMENTNNSARSSITAQGNFHLASLMIAYRISNIWQKNR